MKAFTLSYIYYAHCFFSPSFILVQGVDRRRTYTHSASGFQYVIFLVPWQMRQHPCFPSNIFTPCLHTTYQTSTAAYKTTRQSEMATETTNTTIPATAGEESNTSTTPDEGVLPAVDFGKDKYSCVGPIYEGLGNMWSFNMIPKCKVLYV